MRDVSIRPLVEADALTSVRWRNDASLWTLTAHAPTRQIDDEDELAWIRAVIDRPDERRFAILWADEYVGNIYLTNIDGESGEYHIFIGEGSAQGHGVARRASELLIEYARSELGLLRIDLEVRSDHLRARLLYEALGFVAHSASKDTLAMRLTL